ncbi:MAG: 50S ribosomal protein L11 methyltransferase [Candidatus Poseidoniaceae archaeon]|jgi:methylase of polypeptide subunit release factors|nr:50S ribosomal protein L11 methyltransferase [Candidatus Poseidoniaceae archaeon]
MADKELFSEQDVLDEISRTNRPPKSILWELKNNIKFNLTIPPTVYPPREDTKLMGNRILSLGAGRGRKFLEIGCGSGALSICASYLGWDVFACDINPFAVAATQGNMEENRLKGTIVEGGVGPDGFPFNEKFDLIVWNLPYIPASNSEEEILGPLEEASFLDNDILGLDQRMINAIVNNKLLNNHGKILALSRTEISGRGLAHRVWDKLTFDDGEELVLTCLWNPWDGASNNYIEKTGSTNSDLLKMEGVGTHIRAGIQEDARGRKSRKWTSIEGSYAGSWIVSNSPDINPGFLQICGALAVINSIPVPGLNLKWPNDIIIDGRKVCGILAESQSIGDNINVVLGIGINLKSSDDDFNFDAAYIDELIPCNAAIIDPIITAELASLIELRDDLPPINIEVIKNDALRRITGYGNPIYKGEEYCDFSLDDSFRLVLGDDTIIDDGETIKWNTEKS